MRLLGRFVRLVFQRAIMTDKMTLPEIEQLQRDMDDLQTWCGLLMARDNPVPRSRQAWDVIQRARIAIVELRQTKPANLGTQLSGNSRQLTQEQQP